MKTWTMSEKLTVMGIKKWWLVSFKGYSKTPQKKHLKTIKNIQQEWA